MAGFGTIVTTPPPKGGRLLGQRMMQPSTLAPNGCVPAEKCFGYQLDLSPPVLNRLVRHSRHFITQQVLRHRRFAVTTSYLFVCKSAGLIISRKEASGFPCHLKTTVPAANYLWVKFKY